MADAKGDSLQINSLDHQFWSTKLMATHVQKIKIAGKGDSTQEAASKWVYAFEEGRSNMRDLLGGKGAGLAEMTYIGLPVPPGFTITTEACLAFLKAGGQFPEGMWEQAMTALQNLNKKMGRNFGDNNDP